MLFNDIYYCQFVSIYHILFGITIFLYKFGTGSFFGGGSARKKRRRRESVSRRLVLIRFLLIGPFRHGFRESVAADGRERFFAEVVLDFAGVLLGHGGIHPEAD